MVNGYMMSFKLQIVDFQLLILLFLNLKTPFIYQ